jgi:Fe-S-cluster containining protein
MGEPFYASGLSFSCTRCSRCCRGDPGYIFLSQDDLRALLRRLSLDFKTFFGKYCTLIDTGTGMALSLRDVITRDVVRNKEQAGSKTAYDCVFWSKGGCAVYEDRPVQCSTYPFWASIMNSAASWHEESFACPGIDKGELRSQSYIEERLLARRKAKTIVLDYGADPECSDDDSILGCAGLGSDAPDAVEGQE